MDLVLLVTGIFIGLSVTAPLGPVNFIVIRTALRRNFTVALLAGLGAVAADATFAAMAAYGVREIEQFIDQFARPLNVVGGILLVIIGIRLARSHMSMAQLSLQEPVYPRLVLRKMLTTYALTITNPATFFGFLAIFGTMSSVLALAASPFRPPTIIAGVAMGGALWWALISFVVTRVKSRITGKTFDRINRWTGVLIAAFGFALLMDIFF